MDTLVQPYLSVTDKDAVNGPAKAYVKLAGFCGEVPPFPLLNKREVSSSMLIELSVKVAAVP